MAKIVIQHDIDSAIGIVLEQLSGDRGFAGTCTECGWPVQRWSETQAIATAKQHVDSHVAQVKGIDPSSVVANPVVDHELLVGCNID